jgi:hypothetical protein
MTNQTLTADDIRQITERGMKPSEVERQLQNFRDGFPPMALTEAATTRQGIHKITPKRIEELSALYEDFAKNHKVVKFVPASGAASRMFKHLLEFRAKYRGTPEDQLLLLKDKGPDSVYYFFEHLPDFAFFSKLLDALEMRGLDYDTIMEESRYEKILNTLLTDKGLNYGNLPKALIPFHSYGNQSRTALIEHLFEGAHYARSGMNNCHVHFTTLPDHLDLMDQHFKEFREELEARLKVRFHLEYSIQDPSTDVIAVDMENNPVRDDKGELVFRPGGHGALLKNLGSIKADLIIIKNIDNICHDRCKPDTYLYKKVLAGKLIELQDQIFAFLSGLDNPTPPSMKVIETMWTFLEHKLHVMPPAGSEKWKKEERIEYLRKKFNRPIRVCGMVENEGEPGGGPFWAANPDGTISLQIVESSQVNHGDPRQESIFQSSTHFNPVDIVCSIRDYRGGTFKLKDFMNPKTGFISQKSLDSKTIKAQELPGLWNGSMADWITVFIEVPLSTFNPVKIINDLLRTEHLATN